MDLEGERAIRLIEVNSTGKYVLSEEGKAFISKIQGPLAVISVAGMYRTGKSYLLNRMLLNRSNGFGVGPTVNPCTKGLWCWGKTIIGKTPEGDAINVIVIDTQGIGALDEDQTHDTRIFTLAILAASSFIYNSTGSIDQNALQNLSLVVNLTKNIQLNTSKSEEQQDDPEELAEYFPAFYWIVRDFSLQLMSTDGNQISPKEYLQRALAPQKGFSDDVEQKNRIRRLLSSFFKQRECFTLVRPLVDQKKLQNLDQLQLDQLRPEFVDQVMNFRRRILGRVKPKVFKGKELDGPMYLCLLNSYVTAINNGAVPNIQNAWNYMCQQKCAHAFEESVSYFNEQAEKVIKNIDLNGIDEQILIEQIKYVKQKACDLFEANSVGDKTKFHLKQLRQKLQHKSELLKLENEKISESTLKSYFKKAIQPIQNKLRVKQYGSFQEFMKQLNQFYINLLENGPLLPKKQTVYLTLIKKVIPTAAQLFLKSKIQEHKNLKNLTEQKQTNYQFSIEQLKKQIKQSEQRSKQKLTKLDRQKIQLQLQVEDLRKNMEDTKQKYLLQAQKWQADSKVALDSYRRKQEFLNDKIVILNEQISQLQNQLMTVKCQQQKESALITLKNKQLQSEIEDLRKKQNQTILSLRNLQMSNSDSVKNLTEQYETKSKQKDSEIRRLRTTHTDLEEQLKSIESQMSKLKSDNQDQIVKLKLSLSKKQSQFARATREKQEFEREMKQVSDNQISKLKEELGKITDKLSQAERQLKTYTETSSTKQRNYETQLILLKQKVQFTQLEAKQYKNQLTKNIKQHEEKLAAILQENNEKQNNSAKIEEQSQLYESKIAHLKTDYDQTTKKLSTEIDDLSKQVTELQLELKSTKSKSQMQIDQHVLTIKTLQQQLEGQQGDTSYKITTLQQQFKMKQKNFVDKIQKLEEEMQEMKEEMARQQRQEHEKSQQIVLQLKNYYEIQKDKLESKMVNQKEKFERKTNELRAQFQQKIREQTMELESEYQFLKEKFSQMEEQLMKERTNRKIEVDIKNKQVENLEKTIEQLKGKTDNKEVQLLNKIDRLQKQQSIEKQSLYSKMEQLFTKQSKIEKQKTSLAHAKEQLDKLVQMRQTEVQQLKSELTTLKNKMEADKQLQKSARSDISTKLMYERVEFEKKVALLSQENLHLKQKIQQNQKSVLSNLSSYEDKIRKLKEDHGHQLRANRQKYQIQIETTEAKYQKIKKAGKDREAELHKTAGRLEKQLAIMTQKNASLSDKVKSFEERQSLDNEQYSSNLTSVKGTLNRQKQALKEQLETEQRQRERIQAEKNSLIASYQQEKLLLENRNKFLQEGKQRYRQDYQDTKGKLELIIENNRKKWTQQKTTLELAHSEYIAKIEKKYWQQKQQFSQNVKKQELEYENKLRTLETENRLLNQKLAIQEQNKMGSQNSSDRRLKQVTQNEKKLQIQLDRVKNLRENELAELQNQQKQKENVKLKLKDKQEKYRTLEKQKQHLFYEMQKEKAKWKMQKQSIISRTDQQKQIILKHEKQIEKLQRENEKLKVERKCQKTSMQSMTRFSSNFMDRGMSRSSLQESVLKQNSNNTSQISDTSLFFKE